MPFPVEKAREVAALGEVHHERIPIDVVTGVLVIGPRHRAAFKRGRLVSVVPVHDEPVAVGIEHRDDDDDEVVEVMKRGFVRSRRQRVEKFHGGLGRADFRRVDARADRDDGLVRRCQPFRVLFRRQSRIGKLLIGRADLVEVADVLRR